MLLNASIALAVKAETCQWVNASENPKRCFSDFQTSPDFRVCERFYLLQYNECVESCSTVDELCFRDCGRAFGRDMENCPCKANCPNGCPCPDYYCPARILAINTWRNQLSTKQSFDWELKVLTGEKPWKQANVLWLQGKYKGPWYENWQRYWSAIVVFGCLGRRHVLIWRPSND